MALLASHQKNLLGNREKPESGHPASAVACPDALSDKVDMNYVANVYELVDKVHNLLVVFRAICAHNVGSTRVSETSIRASETAIGASEAI